MYYNGRKYGHKCESTELHKEVYERMIFCMKIPNPVSKWCLAGEWVLSDKMGFHAMMARQLWLCSPCCEDKMPLDS